MVDRFSAMGATLEVPADANAEVQIHDPRAICWCFRDTAAA
jgi:hypothetical protein